METHRIVITNEEPPADEPEPPPEPEPEPEPERDNIAGEDETKTDVGQ